MPTTLEVHGLREVMRGLKQMDEEIWRDVRDELVVGGELVRKEARRRFEPFDRFSAQGFKTVVRPGSRTALITIEQNLRKTSGSHPQWGSLQMTKALIPARTEVMHAVIATLDHVVERVITLHGF